ncbi:MAG: dTMP kinase [Ruminococcus sp.]
MENSNINKKGKIIVIEGLDGSGKATQSALLLEKLQQNYSAKKLSFPDYENPSSTLVQMYLGGRFGSDPNCVNAYAAASFYAVDRVASYLEKWKSDFESGTLIVFDRYTTSNMIYMTSKLPKEEWDTFISWVEDFEYDRLGLPRPDGVIYLDMPTEVSQKLMSKRYQSDESKKDLHEKNVEFLNACRETALYSAEKLGWTVIPCSDGENPLPLDVIADKVLNSAVSFLNNE